jgi:hypothetical protein
MRGSRSLLTKMGLNQIMFIQQLVKTSKDYHVHDKDNKFKASFRTSAHHAIQKSMFNLLINKM